MNIDVFFTPLQVQDELSLQNKTVLVVDVLRASTTIATALKNGARVIIPAASVESAVKYASTLEEGSFLLCGERGGEIIDGFHLGNSPLEYTEEKVKGKTLIYASRATSSLMFSKLTSPSRCFFIHSKSFSMFAAFTTTIYESPRL